jgi:hypothetical protein
MWWYMYRYLYGDHDRECFMRKEMLIESWRVCYLQMFILGGLWCDLRWGRFRGRLLSWRGGGRGKLVKGRTFFWGFWVLFISFFFNLEIFILEENIWVELFWEEVGWGSAISDRLVKEICHLFCSLERYRKLGDQNWLCKILCIWYYTWKMLWSFIYL